MRLLSYLLDIFKAFPNPLIFGVCIVAVALQGPFGHFNDLSFPARLLFWAVAMTGLGIFFNGAILWVLFSPRFIQWPRVWKIALGSLMAGPPGAILLALLDNSFRGSSITPSFLAWLWMCVSVIGFPAALFQYLWREDPATMGDQPIYSVPLLRRLDPSLGGQLISISAQDHYVEVVTEQGSELVLLNFSDALAELDGYPGIQIHRSHWIAQTGMVGLEGAGRKQSLRTTDGRSLPVSRSKLPEVRAMFADGPAGP